MTMTMFYKLAYQNVKRSIKDYAVYFLTLTFGVCLFYVFNSMESQQAMLSLSESQKDIMKVLVTIIGNISVFISCILGFLILYANQFLIKRRKKELGIYMTLGMKKSKISRVLIIETMMIGIISLFVGLIIGVFASQGLALLSAKMFVVEIEAFRFIFSETAMIKTIVYFAIIFFIVILFNTISISRYKLIDLLNASKKNEKLKVKRLWVSVVLFIISVVCLGVSYYLIIQEGILALSLEYFISLALGIIGTFLFFLSLSGFILRVVKLSKGIYFRGLNMFVLRQINSKITTTFVSMTIICLMLLISIGVLSSGAGLSNTMSSTLEEVTPYDISFIDNRSDKDKAKEDVKSDYMVDKMKKAGVWKEELIKDYAMLPVYEISDVNNAKIMKYYEKTAMLPEQTFRNIIETPVPMIALSDYNKSLALIGIKPIVLQENEVALNCNYTEIIESYEKLLADKDSSITINGKQYGYYDKLLNYAYYTTASTTDTGTLIVPDAVLENATATVVFLNAELKEDVKENSRIIKESLKEYEKEQGNYSYSTTRVEIYEQMSGLSVLCCYIAVYIGIVFLITSAAVLALQQLSENSDNQERYKLLRKIGTKESEINKAIFMQIAISFFVPLILAIVHSIVGLKVANEVISYFGYTNAWVGIGTAAIGIVVIYGGYMIATYFCCKAMMRNKRG